MIATMLCVALAAAPAAAGEQAPAASAPAAFSPLWGAADRLDTGTGGRAGPGWRVRLTLLSREAVEGEGEAEVRAGWAGRGGLGFEAAACRAGAGGGYLEGAVSAGRGPTRVTGGVRWWRWDTERLTWWAGRVEHAPAAAVWLSAGVNGPPGGSPIADLRVLVGGDPWAAELRVRDGAWSYGVTWSTRAGVAVQVRMRGADPELGVAWRLGWVELRVKRTGDPLLGAVSTATLTVGGLAP